MAVLVAATAVYLIVQTGLRSESSASPTSTVVTPSKKQAKDPPTYTVRSGDTLSAIAERTGVTLERLEQLNPQIDANTLRAGQKVRLREKKSS